MSPQPAELVKELQAEEASFSANDAATRGQNGTVPTGFKIGIEKRGNDGMFYEVITKSGLGRRSLKCWKKRPKDEQGEDGLQAWEAATTSRCFRKP